LASPDIKHVLLESGSSIHPDPAASYHAAALCVACSLASRIKIKRTDLRSQNCAATATSLFNRNIVGINSKCTHTLILTERFLASTQNAYTQPYFKLMHSSISMYEQQSSKVAEAYSPKTASNQIQQNPRSTSNHRKSHVTNIIHNNIQKHRRD